MPKVARRKRGPRKGRKRTTRRANQHGGIVPLLSLAMPAILAASKAAALSSMGAAANYGVKRGIKSLAKIRIK